MSLVDADGDSVPEQKAFDELSRQVDEQIAGFDGRRALWRSRDGLLWKSQAGLSGITAIAVALQDFGLSPYLRILSIVTSVAVTVLTIAIARTGARQRWVAYTWAYTKLRALRSKMDLIAKLSPAERKQKLSSENVLSLHASMQAILDDVDDRWAKLVTGSNSPV